MDKNTRLKGDSHDDMQVRRCTTLCIEAPNPSLNIRVFSTSLVVRMRHLMHS